MILRLSGISQPHCSCDRIGVEVIVSGMILKILNPWDLGCEGSVKVGYDIGTQKEARARPWNVDDCKVECNLGWSTAYIQGGLAGSNIWFHVTSAYTLPTVLLALVAHGFCLSIFMKGDICRRHQYWDLEQLAVRGTIDESALWTENKIETH